MGTIDRLNKENKNYTVAVQHKETLLWHGLYCIYHPTPSGCDRWFLSFSTKEGYKSEKQALSIINDAIRLINQKQSKKARHSYAQN